MFISCIYTLLAQQWFFEFTVQLCSVYVGVASAILVFNFLSFYCAFLALLPFIIVSGQVRHAL